MPIADVDKYDASKIDGLYRGFVTNNMDPLKLARVQVRIPSVHGLPTNNNCITDEGLPWATPITPIGSGYDHGSCIVPEVGDIVFIFFEDNDRNYPLYLGGCYGRGGDPKSYGTEKDPSTYYGGTWNSPPKHSEIPKEVYNSYGSPTGKVIYKSPKGATILVEEKDSGEAIRIIDRLGQSVNLISPVTPSNNANNSHQRSTSDSRKGTGIDPNVCTDGYTEVSLIDSIGQYAKLVNSDVGSYIEVASGRNGSTTKIILDSSGTTIKTQGGRLLIRTDGTIVLDGSNNITLEATNVTIDSTTCIIRGDLINYS